MIHRMWQFQMLLLLLNVLTAELVYSCPTYWCCNRAMCFPSMTLPVIYCVDDALCILCLCLCLLFCAWLLFFLCGSIQLSFVEINTVHPNPANSIGVMTQDMLYNVGKLYATLTYWMYDKFWTLTYVHPNNERAEARRKCCNLVVWKDHDTS